MCTVGLSSFLGALSSGASPGTRVAGCSSSPANPFIYNPLSISSASPSPSARVRLPRNAYQIRATTLHEKEKVNVDNSFDVTSLPVHEGKQASVDSLASTTGVVERWVIKFEQFVNVALTVRSIPHCCLTSCFPRTILQADRTWIQFHFCIILGVGSCIEITVIYACAFCSFVCNILVQAILPVKESVIKILDAFYHDRHYARFYVLETIARVPYFAFISVLHMYESFGWWRRADYLKVHFAETWNELHHLLIMEELGGNALWFDRLLAQHIAFVYYFMTVFMYAVSPRMAYHFSECVERHAYSTYDKFIKLHGDELKELPAPEIAIKYYTGEDLYLFDEFQTARAPNTRRPQIENLYDVFVNIRDDEAEHCKTMRACQTDGKLLSPHSNPEYSDGDSNCVLPEAGCEGILDCIKKSMTPRP